MSFQYFSGNIRKNYGWIKMQKISKWFHVSNVGRNTTLKSYWGILLWVYNVWRRPCLNFRDFSCTAPLVTNFFHLIHMPLFNLDNAETYRDFDRELSEGRWYHTSSLPAIDKVNKDFYESWLRKNSPQRTRTFYLTKEILIKNKNALKAISTRFL